MSRITHVRDASRVPHLFKDGTYRIAPRKDGLTRNLAIKAEHLTDLDAVVDRMATGLYCLRMSRGGKGRASLIAPGQLLIDGRPILGD